jgi:hypothetical protein
MPQQSAGGRGDYAAVQGIGKLETARVVEIVSVANLYRNLKPLDVTVCKSRRERRDCSPVPKEDPSLGVQVHSGDALRELAARKLVH